MPGNEDEDWNQNQFELNNKYLLPCPCQGIVDNWQFLDYNWLVGRSTNHGALTNPNFKDYSIPQLGSDPKKDNFISVPLDQFRAQLIPGTDCSRDNPIQSSLDISDFPLQCQNFSSKQKQLGLFAPDDWLDQQLVTSEDFYISIPQWDNECAESPSLTTNSERSEITDASSDFRFLEDKRQFLRNKSFGSPETHPMQQSGYNDFQLLQQQLMYKQLQELQRKQQLRQLGDAKQQLVFNQLAKQASGGHFSPLINGTPVHDVSQMLSRRMELLAPAAAQGSLKKAMFSQEPSPAMLSISPSTQQLEPLFYGAPVSEARGSMGQYSLFQGMSYDSVNLSAKAGFQSPKAMTASGFGIPNSSDHHAFPPGLGGVVLEAFVPKQGNFPDANNSSVTEFGGREEQAGWSTLRHTASQAGVSQNLVPLDPIEAKILYNADDNVWDALGGQPGSGAEGVGNALDHPSIQSGSWSALMQSAVAEASSTGSGIHEDWSGLTYQNTDTSSDNHLSNFEKQKTSQSDDDFRNASYSSKTVLMDTDMNSSFPVFQQPESQSSVCLRTPLHDDISQEPIVDFHFQQNQSVKESQKVPLFLHSGNVWPVQMSQHSHSDAEHQLVASTSIANAMRPHDKQQDYYHRDGSNMQQGSVPGSQKDTRMSKELQAGGDHQFVTSNNEASFFPDGSNVNNWTSVPMLDLIHKVDESRDASTNPSEVLRADSSDTTVAQSYSQSVTSHGYGLKLTPSVQKPSSSTYFNSFQDFPQVIDNSNTMEPKSEMGEKNRVWQGTPFSFHSLLPFDVSQRAHWENRSSNASNSVASSDWKISSVALHSSPALYPQNEAEVHAASNVSITSQSVPVTSPGAGSRQMTSSQEHQDNFPVLEALSAPQCSMTSGVSYQSEITASSQNVWRNLPSVAEPPNKTMITTPSVFPGATLENSFQGSSGSSELPVPSLLGCVYGLQHFGVVPQNQIFSKLNDSSNVDNFPQGQGDSGATSFTFQPVVCHPPIQDLDNIYASESNLEAQHATHFGGRQLYHAGLKSSAPPDLLSSEHTKMLNFKEEMRSVPAVKASQLTSLKATPSEETVAFGHSDPNSQSAGINSQSMRDHGYVDPHMAPTWFKQFETLQNGQVVPMVDARHGSAVFPHFSLGNASLIPPSSSERFDVDGTVWPRTATTLVAAQHRLPSLPATEAISKVGAMRSKKRKAEIYDLLPWHKEVIEQSKTLQNFSVAEQIWAKATHHLIERVEDAVETINEMQAVHRPKRRLILTSQLLQQLFFPPPGSIFSADSASASASASSCDFAMYFVSRLSLGDACSFSYHKGYSSITNSEGSSDQQLIKSLEELVYRSSKLENDIQRLDKTASFADAKLEIQDFERFAVINRFAKFHARGPMDISGNPLSSGHPRLNVQKFVTAKPLPKNFPERVQCLSL